MTRVRTPTVLDTTPIRESVGPFCIHPEDLRELRAAYAFVWPGNAPSDVFAGTKLIEDASAKRLPRKPL